MNTSPNFPLFDFHLSYLNKFILELVVAYNEGEIKSWDDLEKRVESFFTPERMNQIESIAPGWKKMASYSGGVTLVHVTCVFLGLFILPEFKSLPFEQGQLAKWIVLFHDIEKETNKGERDQTHGFRSATRAARTLPGLGFGITREYEGLIDLWSRLTNSAMIKSGNSAEYIQDNQKLPEIFDGIKKLFGDNTPASLIVKGVLLHMSIDVVGDWPQAAPLTEEEINKYVDRILYPLLKVMNLADSEGWSMFYTEIRRQQRNDTLKAFEKIDEIILL